MSVRVCTLMWGTAWERYGHKFADTFSEYWDNDIEITTVVDRNIMFPRSKKIMLQNIPAYHQFMDKWGERPLHYEPKREKDIWKWDAKKWMPQGITPHAVLEANRHWVDGDILVWMDADCHFYDYVSESWVEGVLGDHECACLARRPKHTEIGFYALRLNSDTRAAMKKFSDYYSTYEVENLEQWHSAFVWDECIWSNPNIRVNNLTRMEDRGLGGKKVTGHPFPNSVLAQKIEHKKGKLKDN